MMSDVSVGVINLPGRAIQYVSLDCPKSPRKIQWDIGDPYRHTDDNTTFNDMSFSTKKFAMLYTSSKLICGIILKGGHILILVTNKNNVQSLSYIM